ncbi:ubiquitin 3 binding protein But2 [Terfezia claveryi]|nr:ubiquitin 3 binding protein But2 [Terfezia claveryi]
MKTSFTLVSLFTAAAFAVPTHTIPRLIDTLFPHYLVPVKSLQPDTPFGTQHTGTIIWGSGNEEVALIAGFDVPENGATTCCLKFVLPWASSNSWLVSGSGILNFYGLSRPVDDVHDTWNHRPERFPHYPLGQIEVIRGGNGTVTGSIPCHLGTRMDFELVASKPHGYTTVSWFGEY